MLEVVLRKIPALVGAALLATFSSGGTASASVPNYGACVSTNAADPKTDPYSPSNATATEASGLKGGTFWTAILASDGAARFDVVALCGGGLQAQLPGG
jgi:hypothetical protein